jgi:hypothetical protein
VPHRVDLGHVRPVRAGLDVAPHAVGELRDGADVVRRRLGSSS